MSGIDVPIMMAAEIVDVCPQPSGRVHVRLDRHAIRVAGGGQPGDTGWLEHDGARAAVHSAVRQDGSIWLRCENVAFLKPGQKVCVYVDMDRRNRLSRAHTLSHVMMGCLKRHLQGFESRGAEIADDGLSISLFFIADGCSTAQRAAVMQNVRGVVDQAVPVEVTQAKSTETAACQYPLFRVDSSLGLSGRVRLIHIDGVDTNPCSGTHVANTSALGNFTLTSADGHDGCWTIIVNLQPKGQNQVIMRDRIESGRITY